MREVSREKCFLAAEANAGNLRHRLVRGSGQASTKQAPTGLFPQFWSRNAPEHSLDIDNGLGVCHVVLLSAHCALLVYNHQIVCVNDAALQEVVQAVAFGGEKKKENQTSPSPVKGSTPTTNHVLISAAEKSRRSSVGDLDPYYLIN